MSISWEARSLDLLLPTVRERELKTLHPPTHSDQQLRQVIALHHLRCRDAQPRLAAATQTVRHLHQPAEKRRDELIERLSFTRQLKRPPLIQRDAKCIFELQNLRADGWLLNAVGHGASRRAHPAVPGHIVEEFEVMDVHALTGRLYGLSMMPPGNINFHCPPTLRHLAALWTKSFSSS